MFSRIPNNYKESVLVYLFQALPNYQEAVNLIINYASVLGRKNSCKRVIIGLNSHINAGAGTLIEEFITNSYGSNHYLRIIGVNFQ